MQCVLSPPLVFALESSEVEEITPLMQPGSQRQVDLACQWKFFRRFAPETRVLVIQTIAWRPQPILLVTVRGLRAGDFVSMDFRRVLPVIRPLVEEQNCLSQAECREIDSNYSGRLPARRFVFLCLGRHGIRQAFRTTGPGRALKIESALTG